jgi:hypothetical protein
MGGSLSKQACGGSSAYWLCSSSSGSCAWQNLCLPASRLVALPIARSAALSECAMNGYGDFALHWTHLPTI